MQKSHESLQRNDSKSFLRLYFLTTLVKFDTVWQCEKRKKFTLSIVEGFL